jgi:hypothetical protein
LTDLTDEYSSLDSVVNNFWPCRAPYPEQLFENLEDKWFKRQQTTKAKRKNMLSLTHTEVFKDKVMVYLKELGGLAVGYEAGLKVDAKKCKAMLREKLENEWSSYDMNIVTSDFVDAATVKALVNKNL